MKLFSAWPSVRLLKGPQSEENFTIVSQLGQRVGVFARQMWSVSWSHLCTLCVCFKQQVHILLIFQNVAILFTPVTKAKQWIYEHRKFPYPDSRLLLHLAQRYEPPWVAATLQSNKDFFGSISSEIPEPLVEPEALCLDFGPPTIYLPPWPWGSETLPPAAAAAIGQKESVLRSYLGGGGRQAAARGQEFQSRILSTFRIPSPVPKLLCWLDLALASPGGRWRRHAKVTLS